MEEMILNNQTPEFKESIAEVESELAVSNPAIADKDGKVLGEPNIREYDSTEEVLVDTTAPLVKQKLSALYMMIKPEVDKFFEDKHKLNQKYDALYLKYTKKVSAAKEDIKRAQKNLEIMNIELKKAEKEFEAKNETSFDPASYDSIVAPKAETVNLWNSFINVKSRELNRYKFVKTKIFSKEKSITQFIKHSTAVHIILMCLKENEFKNPFDLSGSEEDKANFVKVEEIRLDLFNSEEFNSIPEEINEEWLEKVIKKYATSYVGKKKETAVQHRELAIKFLDDLCEKYGVKVATPDSIEPADIANVEAIVRKNKLKGMKALLHNNAESIIPAEEREYVTEVLNYVEFWCDNQSIDFVIDTSTQLDPFMHTQVISVFKRRIKEIAPLIYPGEPVNRAEAKTLLAFICTTLSDSIELCIGLL